MNNNKNKKNVLIISTSFPRWSGDFDGSFVFELSKRLASYFNIFVLTPHYPGTKIKETIDGFFVYRFRYFWPSRLERVCSGPGILPNLKKNKFLFFILPFLFISQFFKIIYLIKKEKIDLIHAHWFLPSGLIAVWASKICCKPLIVTSHGPDILGLRGKFFDQIRGWIINKADLITVISPFFVKQLAEKSHIDSLDKISSISMGVETSFFRSSLWLQEEGKKQLIKKLGFCPKKPILLFVGILSKHKGIEYLIKAMPAIIKSFQEANLVIIGEGSYKKEFKKLSLNLGLDKKIFFFGSISNKELPYYYNQADVFILPSLREGLPVVLMEAMSAGCPVIATRIAGIPDMIKDKKNGLLIDIKSESEISRAVIKILSDNNLRKSVIKEARKTAKDKYDWQIIANRFNKLYKKVI